MEEGGGHVPPSTDFLDVNTCLMARCTAAPGAGVAVVPAAVVAVAAVFDSEVEAMASRHASDVMGESQANTRVISRRRKHVHSAKRGI